MKPAFRLDQHPRRPLPVLNSPPAGYFEQLPGRVMARLPQAEANTDAGWSWLLKLAPVWRTSLASSALLASFVASFWLSGSGGSFSEPQPLAALDQVPRAELVGYLLSSETQVETADLIELTAARPGLTNGLLQASAAEITDALDAQPAEDTIIL
jgi:hypothetical protein